MTEDLEHRKCWHDLAVTAIGIAILAALIGAMVLTGYSSYAIFNMEIVIE